MKLSLKLAALIIAFGAFLLPFIKPQTANAAGCQLIVSTTEVVAHGSFNVTVQNGQFPGTEYIIKFVENDILYHYETFIMPASGSQTYSESLDTIFSSTKPLESSGQFTVTAGTNSLPPTEACSPATGILITVIAPPPPTASITAASTNIPYNTSTTLTWTSTNADTCTINGSNVATNGSQPTGNLTTTTTFTLICTNVSGSATAAVTVTVQPPPAPTCSPPSQSTTIGTSVSFTASAGNGTFSWSAPGGNPSTGSGSSFSTSYSTTGTKTVTVTSGSQNATCSVTVTAPAPTPDIKANNSNGPITIGYNATATLTWTSTNATTCTLNGSSIALQNTVGQPTGNLTNPTYTFTLSCTGPGGTTQDSVVVNVNPPTPCSYTFSPSTVASGGAITVTITAGDPAHSFYAAIVSTTKNNTRTSLGDIPLTAPTVTVDTNYTVAVRDDVTKVLCGGQTALTVTAPLVWHLDQPIVASNQLSVLFSFTPASNGNIALIVDPDPAFSSFPRPFDSGAIKNGDNQVTWNFPPPGTYYAELVYLGVKISDNVVRFTVSPPALNTWTLSLNNCSGNQAFFNISPGAGTNSFLVIRELPLGDPNREVLISSGATTVAWTNPTITPTSPSQTFHAVISYWATDVSNPAQVTLPCNPEPTQWTLSIQNISGNDITFNVQCPTKDCPGIGGEAVVIIKDLGTQKSFPAGGGTVTFTGLPNGTHQAVVVVFLSEESGVVDFTLPQKTTCGWLAFPGGAGIVSGPVNNCALASPTGVISAILPYIFGIAGFLSIIIIVISGIQFITSSGNPEAAASARNRLVFALIGLAIIILAFAILQIVDKLFLGGSGVS